jgi:hypothetical protein
MSTNFQLLAYVHKFHAKKAITFVTHVKVAQCSIDTTLLYLQKFCSSIKTVSQRLQYPLDYITQCQIPAMQSVLLKEVLKIESQKYTIASGFGKTSSRTYSEANNVTTFARCWTVTN